MSSSELLRKSPGNLLRNFLRHFLDIKSGQELQQRVYNAVLRKPIEDEDNVLTLTLFNNTEIKIGSSPFLNCFSASGVPLNNIKKIQAGQLTISEKNWDAFNIQTLTGTVLYQLVSLCQSWSVDRLMLNDLGPEDWTELSRSLDTLDSVIWVRIDKCSALPSVSLLETLWNKTEERWSIGEENEYYNKNEGNFSKLLILLDKLVREQGSTFVNEMRNFVQKDPKLQPG